MLLSPIGIDITLPSSGHIRLDTGAGQLNVFWQALLIKVDQVLSNVAPQFTPLTYFLWDSAEILWPA